MLSKAAEEHAYLLGLFRADGYTWTGTFGVTNRNPKILKKASAILSQFGEPKLRKDSRGEFRADITSRPRRREFDRFLPKTQESLFMNRSLIPAYFAGKYDGDGSYWKSRLKCKITYGKPKNIEFDQKLLLSVGVSSSVRKYRNRNAYDLEISSANALVFFEMIRKHSIKCPL